MELFIVEDHIVRPNVEILLVPPFTELWERDKSAGKGKVLREFAFIEFMCSMKKSNPYKGYSDEQKPIKIIERIFSGEEYEPDEVVCDAMEVYTEFQNNASPSLSFYRSALKGAKKLEDFFTTLDMNERNSREQPLHKPGEITRALKDTFDVLKTLRALEDKVAEEIYEDTKTRGGKEINPFER